MDDFMRHSHPTLVRSAPGPRAWRPAYRCKKAWETRSNAAAVGNGSSAVATSVSGGMSMSQYTMHADGESFDLGKKVERKIMEGGG